MGPQSVGTLPSSVDDLGFGMTDLSPFGVSNALKKPRVAVLVDGENVRAEYAGKIISKSLSAGDLMVRRVYGNAATLKKWQTAPGFRIMHSGTGKNATDILLAVEAMSLVLTKQVDVLVIVSSDRDFTHLATNLRETGHLVIGMGEGKASEAFRKACVRFEVLAELAGKIAAAPAANPEDVVQVDLPEVDRQIRELIMSAGSDHSMGVAQLGTLFRQKHNKSATVFGSATWSSYFRQHPTTYELLPNGGNPRVRLKRP
jgi:uncharacterized protein (TIGR00288 family)